MKIKISNIKFHALDNLINSDIIKVNENTQIIFGEKKLYQQSCKSRIDVSIDSIVMPCINIQINAVSISDYK